MALIQCPNCKKQVSDVTKSCGYCGHGIIHRALAEDHDFVEELELKGLASEAVAVGEDVCDSEEDKSPPHEHEYGSSNARLLILTVVLIGLCAVFYYRLPAALEWVRKKTSGEGQAMVPGTPKESAKAIASTVLDAAEELLDTRAKEIRSAEQELEAAKEATKTAHSKVKTVKLAIRRQEPRVRKLSSQVARARVAVADAENYRHRIRKWHSQSRTSAAIKQLNEAKQYAKSREEALDQARSTMDSLRRQLRSAAAAYDQRKTRERIARNELKRLKRAEEDSLE